MTPNRLHLKGRYVNTSMTRRNCHRGALMGATSSEIELDGTRNTHWSWDPCTHRRVARIYSIRRYRRSDVIHEWPKVRREPDRIHPGRFAGVASRIAQHICDDAAPPVRFCAISRSSSGLCGRTVGASSRTAFTLHRRISTVASGAETQIGRLPDASGIASSAARFGRVCTLRRP